MTDSFESKARCTECDGEGRIWNNADPTSGQSADCEHCSGSGECGCDDCVSTASENAFSDMCESEPPISAQERYEAAAREKRELRR